MKHNYCLCKLISQLLVSYADMHSYTYKQIYNRLNSYENQVRLDSHWLSDGSVEHQHPIINACVNLGGGQNVHHV